MKKMIIAVALALLFSGYGTAMAGHGKKEISTGFAWSSGDTVFSVKIGSGGYSPYRIYDERAAKKRYRKHRNDNHRLNRYHKRYRKKRGHWVVRRVWVPPVYEIRCADGRYNRRGYWIPGERQRVMVKGGYWSRQRVWLPPRR